MVKLKGMEWKRFSRDIMSSGKPAEVRSLRIPDDVDKFRRYRVTTCWDTSRPKFTRTPALGFLARDDTGRIGAVIIGRSGGYIKIGSRLSGCQQSIFVPLNSLSEKVRKSFLREGTFDLFTEGNLLFARQREDSL